MKLIKNLMFILLFILPFTFIKAQTIYTDRSDMSDSPNTIYKSAFQVETGGIMTLTENDNSKTNEITAPLTLLRYGLTEKFELRLVHQFTDISLNKEHFTRGFNDLQIGGKYTFYEGEKMQIGLISQLNLPTGNPDLSESSLNLFNLIAINHDINEDIAFAYNFAYTGLDTNGEYYASAVLAIGVTDRFGFFTEFYGDYIRENDPYVNFDAGFTYLLTEKTQIDFSFGTGVNYNMNFLSGGLSWLFIDSKG